MCLICIVSQGYNASVDMTEVALELHAWKEVGCYVISCNGR